MGLLEHLFGLSIDLVVRPKYSSAAITAERVRERGVLRVVDRRRTSRWNRLPRAQHLTCKNVRMAGAAQLPHPLGIRSAMSTIKVSIRLVNGSLQEFTEGPEFLHKLRSLQSQGLTGQELVDCLISDDWGAPPIVVEISWKDSDGKNYEIRIPYD
jgi:hypothetical protein